MGNDNYNKKPRQELPRVSAVTIEGGDNDYGVSLLSGGTFTADSTGLTIRNTMLGPIKAGIRLAHTIPTGSYTGNKVDEIVLWHDSDSSSRTRRCTRAACPTTSVRAPRPPSSPSAWPRGR